MLRGDALPGVRDIDADARRRRSRCGRQRAAAVHRVAGIQDQIQETCCSLPALPLTPAAGLGSQFELDVDARLVQLVLDQRDRLLDDPVQVHFAELVGEVREKFSSELTISLARKVCLAILSSSFDFCIVAGHLLGQHLRIGRDHGERRIDLVRDTGRQQADAELSLSACTSRCSSSERSVMSSKMISRPICSMSFETSGAIAMFSVDFAERAGTSWPLPLPFPLPLHAHGLPAAAACSTNL